MWACPLEGENGIIFGQNWGTLIGCRMILAIFVGVGSFNMVSYLGERRNCVRITSAMRKFLKIIKELTLQDLLLNGGLLI